mmetsp:Transcript_17094/g.51011  ORF Transcript_17094/g.51011 Transcript_17094/m.51011 type:complete len:174 (-) Transcript_17094:26-547(-)
MLRAALLALAIPCAAARRPRRLAAVGSTVGEDGQKKVLFESYFAREWLFDQKFSDGARAKWRKSGPVRVKLDKTRVAAFRGAGSLRGIWNHKADAKPNFLEMELPLNRADDHYLLYRANCKPGRFFDNAVTFEEGVIYEVTSFLPSRETMTEVGRFSVQPATSKPVLDRKLRC